jgi:proteasome beta subunit
MAYPAFIPGATVVGMIYADGVILGAEKRISYGTYVTSRSGKKVFKITDNVGAAAAGMIADMQVLIRQVQSHTKILELELKRPIAPNSIAKLMSVIMFQQRYYPLLTQIILAGVDTEPSVYVLDPLGSVIPDEYATVGSGAELAIGIVEAGYRKGMSEKEASDLVIKSIKTAIARDSSSGDGADLLVINREGTHEKNIPM